MRHFLSLILLFVAINASAAKPDDVVAKAMAALAPGVKVDVAQESVIPGFYEAIVGEQFIYVSKDGRFILDGSVFDVGNQQDLTESARAAKRVAGLASVGADKRIIFAPANPKYSVTVFTDIDCPFCRRFHDRVPEYNAQGIAVEYVFLPLDIHPGADKKAEAVWCAKDRKLAFTAAMSGADTGNATCENPVAETTRVARQIGVSGTPTILAADGSKIAPQIAAAPDKLAAELERLANISTAKR